MGYTHYWNAPNEPLEDELLADIRKVVNHGFESTIIQREDDEAEPPIATSDNIFFNGIDGDGHETFCFDTNGGWTFCKTARKPYDRYVVAILALIGEHIPSFDWTSDGEPEDHADGLVLLKELTGIDGKPARGH